MRPRHADRALVDRLAAVAPPGAGAAEDRAWRVVRAAHVDRGPAAASPGRRVRLVAALAAAALLLAVLAFTPAGATVGDWIESVVKPGRDDARPALTSLPEPGRLLVQSGSGPWIVQQDGAARRLGGWREASWSPNGLYVIAARRHEVAALDPRGAVRWTRPRAGGLAAPRWSPDGFRVAYRSGAALHVVAGDNSGPDRVVARRTAQTAPAWRPGLPPLHQAIAYAAGGRVGVVEVDTGRALGRTPREPRPLALWWAMGGRRLVAVAPDALRVHDAHGRLLRTLPMRRGLRAEDSALAYDGTRIAVVARARRGRLSEVSVYRVAGGPPRLLYADTGTFTGLAWSPGGQVLALAWPEADQWLFLRPGRRTSAVAGIARHFGAGARPAGWCYPEPATRPTSYSPCAPPAG